MSDRLREIFYNEITYSAPFERAVKEVFVMRGQVGEDRLAPWENSGWVPAIGLEGLNYRERIEVYIEREANI